MSNDDPAALSNISARLAAARADLAETLGLLQRNITARGADPFLTKAVELIEGAANRVEEADAFLVLSEEEFAG